MRPLPDEFIIGGRYYPIKTDYRIWLSFMSGELAYNKLFKISVPAFNDEVARALTDFIECRFEGQEQEVETKEQAQDYSESVVDFSIDAPYIYAGFLQAYAIDILNIKELHWFKFRALFKALPEETMISQIIRYRSYKGDDKEMLRLRDYWALPKKLTKEEKEAQDYFEQVWG